MLSSLDLVLVPATTSAVAPNGLPHLTRSANGNTQLIVDGKPFPMLGGELHNSSLSSAKFMDEVFPAMAAQSVNTLLGAVSWEDIEPKDGEFNFIQVDGVQRGARQNSMRLVLIWFGTYKNDLSSYVPGWVKRDTKRFTRVQIWQAGGVKKNLEMISPLSEECVAPDSRALRP